MPVRLDAFNALALRSFTFSRSAKLQNENVLFKFGNGSENLSNQATCRIVRTGKVDTIRRDDARADLRKLAQDHLLNHQITRQAVSSLNDDRSDAIRFESIYKPRKAWTIGKFLRAAHAQNLATYVCSEPLSPTYGSQSSRIPRIFGGLQSVESKS